MTPKQSEGVTKELRVISYVVPCVFKCNFLNPYIVLLPLELLVIRKQLEGCDYIDE